MLDVIRRKTAGDTAQSSAGDGALSPLERITVQTKTLNPLYDMIKDGDVGSHLPTAEDAKADKYATELGGPDPVGGHFNDDDTMVKASRQSLDDEDSEEEEDLASFSASTDPVAERIGLMAQLKILEVMLRQVEAEEQQRTRSDNSVVPASVCGMSSSRLLLGEITTSKRQRRPNPKYFDAQIEVDFVAGSSYLKGSRTYGAELSEPVDAESNGQVQSADKAAACPESAPSLAQSTFSGVFDRFSSRPGSTHRARTAMAQKPRFFSIPDDHARSTEDAESFSHLDGLSIRELHDSYRATFGRETSVKDKQWLKRQIFLGSTKTNASILGKENTGQHGPLPESGREARLATQTAADVQQSAFPSVGMNGQITCEGFSLRDSHSAANSIDTKKGKTLSLATLSPLRPSAVASAAEFHDSLSVAEIGPPVQHKEDLVGVGKRLRKPNRRYIDDEGDTKLGLFGRGKRSMVSTYLISGSEQQSGPLSFLWRRDAEKVGDDFGKDALKTSVTRVLTRSRTSHRQRSKNYSTGMKHKDVGRTANAVKKAHLTLAAKLDGDGGVRKIKFRLPADPGQKPVELQNGHEEQVSCALPVLMDEPSEEYQILSSHYLGRSEGTASERAVVTVPTANGGVRRKHHRPWTLREVAKLVEGVARCGGGKWADIKKLAFSTIGYRTAVDLKDKWRNLLRASRAQLLPPKQGEVHKKQFSASIPSHILARVRDLSTDNNQTVRTTNPGTSKISKSKVRNGGRSVHRR